MCCCLSANFRVQLQQSLCMEQIEANGAFSNLHQIVRFITFWSGYSLWSFLGTYSLVLNVPHMHKWTTRVFTWTHRVKVYSSCYSKCHVGFLHTGRKKIVSTGTEHLTWSSVDPESYQEEGMCMQCMQLPFWKNGHTIPGFDIDWLVADIEKWKESVHSGHVQKQNWLCNVYVHSALPYHSCLFSSCCYCWFSP